MERRARRPYEAAGPVRLRTGPGRYAAVGGMRPL